METKTKLDLKNIKTCSFDTNILLRWLLQDDLEQAEMVQSFLDNPKLKKVYISDLVILEVVWVMESVYKLDRNEVKEGLEIVLEYPKFVVSKDLFKQVLADYVKNESISFADYTIGLYSKIKNFSPLITFDQKLARKILNVELLG